MGLFEPAWKTKDLGRLGKAYSAVRKISSAGRLNRIILKAPLDQVKIEAMGRLSTVSKRKNVRLDEDACADALLSLDKDIGRLSAANGGLCGWYINFLLSGIRSEQKKLDLILKNEDFGNKAVGLIRDDALLVKITESPDAAEPLRIAAAEGITDEKALRSLAGNDSLPQGVRNAVKKKTDELDEAERKRQEAEALRRKQQNCGISGHKLEIVRYIPHGNGGQDGVYRCKLCGAEQIWPAEWSSADSV